MTLTREQVKAARAVRGWGVRDLAEATTEMFGAGKGVGFTTINRFENGADSKGDTLRKLQACLEAEGFTFLNSGQPGIRWDASTPERWALSATNEATTAKPKKGKGRPEGGP